MDIEAVQCSGNEIKIFQFKIFREIRRFINLAKSIFRWNVHCKKQLEYTESLMLSTVKTPHKRFFVDLGNCVGTNDRIWTLAMNTDLDHEQHTPMVLLHGYASALAFWMLNLDTFAAERPVYAVDLLGFGKSSRPTFSNEPQEIEEQYVAFLEDWRKAMKLEKMILLAHSFGGWIACLYALKYPERVQHLILADPWGLDSAPCLTTHPFLKRLYLRYFTKTPPMNFIRVFGPFAPRVFRNLRQDVVGKFETVMADRHKKAISEYIYHCNSVKISGERAFHSLLENGPWPRFPLAARMHDIHTDIPLTFVYGQLSWIDSTPGYKIKLNRPNSYTQVEIVDGVGHKVFSDDENTFHSIVLNACKILKSNNVQ